ncbi:MAG: potassium channel family protein [Anaeroplasmataceae bacterium]
MKKNKTIVIGCGRLGSSIATMLSTKGKNVIMIDKDSISFRKLADAFNGYTIEGDATDVEFLSKVYIKDASSVIIVSDNEDANIFIAHVCQYIFDVENIFARIFDSNKAKLLDQSRVSLICPFILSRNEFADLYDKQVGDL